MKDNEFFRGDNKKLVESIEALLSLDAKGSLAPHGIGSHARTLLSAAVERLPVGPAPIACCTCGKPTACGKMICEACCYESLPVPPAGSTHPVPIDDTGYGMVMPPAGGEPEVPTAAWLDLEKVAAGMAYATALKVNHRQTELVDRAHVTQLKAEVDKFKKAAVYHSDKADEARAERDALQSELTKARELVVEGLKHIGYLSNTVLQCSQGDGLAAANERCALAYAALSFNQRAQILLSNQSAPADNGPDDCAHSEANKHGFPECGEEFKRADKGQGEPVADYPSAEIAEEAALGIYDIDFPSPEDEQVEQPAPVAVVSSGRPNLAEQLESLAKQIYDSWQTQPGFVPWVNGGNSLKQDEARQIASRTFELALANQAE